MLMQEIGNMRYCWKLNTAACRVCEQLWQCPLADLEASKPEQESLIQTLFMKCYIFDRVLSANIYQPASLANFDVNPAVLDSRNPSDAMLSALVAYAKVMDVIIKETRRCTSPGKMNQLDTNRLKDLSTEMIQIRQKCDEVSYFTLFTSSFGETKAAH